MYATVKMIEEFLQAIAPFETAEAYDNVGALVGRRDQEVTGILVALDATLEVVREAEEKNADLIVTHHPLMFHSRKTMLEEEPEAAVLCELIRNRISLISAHTNLDQTFYSGSACCGKLLSLLNLRQESPYLFLGELKTPVTAAEMEHIVEDTLRFPVRRYGDENRILHTLAIAGGAADGEWTNARNLGADALLTGEVHHHHALAASMSQFVLFDGGHYGTEAPLVSPLAEYLQKQLDDVKCNVRVFPSCVAPFGDMI